MRTTTTPAKSKSNQSGPNDRTHSDLCYAKVYVRQTLTPWTSQNQLTPHPHSAPPKGAWLPEEATMPAAAKPFAICRAEKIKTWSTLSKRNGHVARTTASTREHLNPKPTEANVTLCGDAGWMKDFKELVKGMWLPKLKQGTTHTLAREFVLTASPEWFAGKTKKQRDEWARANTDWLIERFGADRVAYAELHVDEQTPHIQAFVLPLKADTNRKGEVRTDRGNGWTLSDMALGLGGHSNELSVLQDEYAAAMERFELHRGIKGSKAKHQTIAQWRNQMARPIDKPIVTPKPIEPTLADRINIEGYGQRVAKAAAADVFKQMKPYHQQAKAQAKELREIRTTTTLLQPAIDGFKRLLELLLGREPDLYNTQELEAAQKAFIRFAEALKAEKDAKRIDVWRPTLPPVRTEKTPKPPARAGRSPGPRC